MNKYEQLINYYRQQIVDKLLKPGDQLPNEIEIAQAFKVSRMTANKALNILAQEGCIRRVKGQGSFVDNQQIVKAIGNLTSFTDDITKMGQKPGAILIEYRIERADKLPKLMEKMKPSPDDAIHYIVRIRTADETPIAISYTYLSQKYMSSVDLRKIEGSVYQIMQENGAQFKYSDGEMTAMMPTEEEKRLLKIKDVALLRNITWMYDQDDDLIEYTEMLYIGSRYNYYYRTVNQ